MKTIKQKFHNTCVAATLAMVVGESEEYVINWFAPNEPPFGMIDATLFLASHGVFLLIETGLQDEVFKDGRNLSEFSHIETSFDINENPAILIVKSATYGITHAVYLFKGKVFDPIYDKPQELKNYKVISFIPLQITEMRLKNYEK